MKNKTLDNIHCFVTVVLCCALLFSGYQLYHQKQIIKEYKQITNDAIKVAEECLRMKK